MWSAAKRPATMAAALEPSPRATGMSLRISNRRPSAAWRRSNALTQRFSRSAGRPSSPASTSKLPNSVTSSSRWMSSAAARTSKPGPRFAEDAGTLTRRLRSVIGSLLPLDRASDRVARRVCRLGASEHRIQRLAHPGRVLIGIHVVRVGGSLVADAKLGIEDVEMRRDLRRPRPRRFLAFVVEIRKRPVLGFDSVAHGLQRVVRIALGVVRVHREKAHAAIPVVARDLHDSVVP